MPNNNRLLSLDFFRGFAVAGMILVNNPGSWAHVYPPLLHAQWHGWTPTDLIFPFFLFIVGVSISLALTGMQTHGIGKNDLFKKVFRRSLIIFALGLFLSGFPFFDLSTLRIPGVLQRIALCYLFASIIFLNGSVRTQVIWTFGLLLTYWAAMEWFPVPEIGAGSYEKAANFSAWLDNMLLSGHMWSQSITWDPEGVFSTLPAISTTLFGVLTGHLLLSEKTQTDKSTRLLIWGVIAIAGGYVWSHWLPINKSLWTSSYAVLMSGISMVLLSGAYYLIDIKGWRAGIKPFQVYGMNAITVFVLSGVIGRLLSLIKWQSGDYMITLKEWLMNTFFNSWLSPINASLAYALCFVLISYLAMYWLYRKNIFIKV